MKRQFSPFWIDFRNWDQRRKKEHCLFSLQFFFLHENRTKLHLKSVQRKFCGKYILHFRTHCFEIISSIYSKRIEQLHFLPSILSFVSLAFLTWIDLWGISCLIITQIDLIKDFTLVLHVAILFFSFCSHPLRQTHSFGKL